MTQHDYPIDDTPFIDYYAVLSLQKFANQDTAWGWDPELTWVENVDRIVEPWIEKHKPDLVLKREGPVQGDGEVGIYMERWIVDPHTYIHRFTGSDGPIPHDHPWDSVSVLLSGKLQEVLFDHPNDRSPEGARPRIRTSFEIRPGQVRYRKATDIHRLMLASKTPAVTVMGLSSKYRTWGFYNPHFQPHQEALAGLNPTDTGWSYKRDRT